jgi:hypothetical protein
MVMSAVGTPSGLQAAMAQEDPSAQGDRAAASQAIVQIDVDVATGDAAEVSGTLEELQANVANQLSQLDAAQTAVTAAETAVTEADAAVATTQAEIDRLTALSDEVVIAAFITPPSVEASEAFSADSISEITLKQAILGMQADDDADVLSQLEDARQQLEDQEETQSERVAEADASKAQADAALADVQAATGQQAEFLGAIQARLDQGLAEAAALADLDPEMAADLQARSVALADELQAIADSEAFEAALAALAEAERQRAEEAAANPPDPVTLGPASGSLATAACPAGGSITVDSTLEGPLSSLLADAAAEGVMMCGSGYRSAEEQIQVRINNCGSSDYAIYQMPASDCSPPTARPGTSQHETGLAIDFTCNGGGVISSSSSPCYVWLDANAAGYGLYQLPSELWHFSTTGN